MTKDITRAVARSRDTLLSDALGAASLFVILVTGLCLPGLL